MNIDLAERVTSEPESENSTGHVWSEEKTNQFLEAYATFKGNWKEIAESVGTTSIEEVCTYWPGCHESMSQESKETMYCNYRRKENKGSKQQGWQSQSFFGQKIAPIIRDGYMGLASLVKDFPDSPSTRDLRPSDAS